MGYQDVVNSEEHETEDRFVESIPNPWWLRVYLFIYHEEYLIVYTLHLVEVVKSPVTLKFHLVDTRNYLLRIYFDIASYLRPLLKLESQIWFSPKLSFPKAHTRV